MLTNILGVIRIVSNVFDQNDLKKPPEKIPGESAVKCPKCGHEFYCDPGWIKASAMSGCPKCGETIQVREPGTD